MSTKTLFRVGGVIAGVVLVTALLAAQSPSQQGMPELLVEVRALRAEVNQAAGASMRMQLLLARLTLQEQRISAAARQLADVQRQLAAVTNDRAELESRIGQMKNAIPKEALPDEARQAVQVQLDTLDAALTRASAAEQQLRTQESDLSNLITTEQGRWRDFNAKLDELERSLPVGSR